MKDQLLPLHPDGLLAAGEDRLVRRLGSRPCGLGQAGQPLVQHLVELLRQLDGARERVLRQVDFDADVARDAREVNHGPDDGAVRRVQELSAVGGGGQLGGVGVGEVAVVVLVAA